MLICCLSKLVQLFPGNFTLATCGQQSLPCMPKFANALNVRMVVVFNDKFHTTTIWLIFLQVLDFPVRLQMYHFRKCFLTMFYRTQTKYGSLAEIVGNRSTLSPMWLWSAPRKGTIIHVTSCHREIIWLTSTVLMMWYCCSTIIIQLKWLQTDSEVVVYFTMYVASAKCGILVQDYLPLNYFFQLFKIRNLNLLTSLRLEMWHEICAYFANARAVISGLSHLWK